MTSDPTSLVRLASRRTTMRVAAVQAEPVWLDLQAGVDKVCRLIKEAGELGCELVGFPEVFVPGYPAGIYANAPDPQWQLKYQQSSLVVDSAEYNQIRQATKDAGIWAIVGFSERDRSSLYIAQSIINPNGEVALHRRKMKPTYAERYVFGDSTSSSTAFNVVQTDSGIKIGALNCWEHLQPLLRFHEYSQGVQVHVASWPQLAPTDDQDPSFASSANASGKVISRMMSIEGQCFVLVCTSVTSKEGARIMGLNTDAPSSPSVPIEGGGFSAIFGPTGNLLAEAKDPFSEEMVVADLDMDKIHLAKQEADCCGHYSRPDIFQLHVNVEDAANVRYSDGRHTGPVASTRFA